MGGKKIGGKTLQTRVVPLGDKKIGEVINSLGLKVNPVNK